MIGVLTARSYEGTTLQSVIVNLYHTHPKRRSLSTHWVTACVTFGARCTDLAGCMAGTRAKNEVKALTRKIPRSDEQKLGSVTMRCGPSWGLYHHISFKKNEQQIRP